tara:strand:+ start:845 stop:1999 length:1155 start_codon:yes stop_codon:yes gene_type:complete
MDDKTIIYNQSSIEVSTQISDIYCIQDSLYYSKNDFIYSNNKSKQFPQNILSFTFNLTGSECFILFQNKSIDKYILETPWDITTSYICYGSFNINDSENIEYFEKNNKKLLFITSNNSIYTYDISDWNNIFSVFTQLNPFTNTKQSISIDSLNSLLYLLNTQTNTVYIYNILDNFTLTYIQFFFMGSDYLSKCISFNQNSNLYFLCDNKLFEYLIQPNPPLLIDPNDPHLIIKLTDNIYDIYDDCSLKDGFTGLPTSTITSLSIWDNMYSIPSYSMNITLKNTGPVVFSHIMSYDNIIVVINNNLTLSLHDNNTILVTSNETFIENQFNSISFKRSIDLLHYQVFLNDILVINYLFPQNNNQTFCYYTYLRDNTNFEVEKITQN